MPSVQQGHCRGSAGQWDNMSKKRCIGAILPVTLQISDRVLLTNRYGNSFRASAGHACWPWTGQRGRGTPPPKKKASR